MHPVCHFYGKLIANLFVLLLIRKLWRQMFFDKLCRLLTTGLSLFAGELHNLLNIERIVMHLVIQVLIELQSPIQLALELNVKGYRTKTGKAWNLKNLFRILRNCIYAGLMPYKSEVYPGEHEAIIDRETWEKVQQYLGREKGEHGATFRKPDTIVALKGLVHCGHCGGPMKLATTKKRNRSYGYFRCSKDDNRAESKCPVRHISSIELERAVFKLITSVLRSPVMLNWLNEISHAGIREIAKAIGDGFWDEATPEERRLLAEFLIARINLYSDRLELEIKADGFSSFKDQIDNESQSETVKTEMLPNGNVLASIPFDMQISRKGKRLVLPDGEVTDKSRTAFLMAVARGRKWQRDIDKGKVRDIKELTEILQLDHSYVSRVLRLAHLAPPLIEKVINDRMPENMSVARLRKGMSNNWDDQLQEFRIEA